MLFFWGTQAGRTDPEPTEITIDGEKVVDMATSVGCEFSVLKTMSTISTKSTVYIWGEWYGANVSKPRATSFYTMEEAFAAADPPWLYRTVEFPHRGLRVSDTMQAAFDNKVTTCDTLPQEPNCSDSMNDRVASL